MYNRPPSGARILLKKRVWKLHKGTFPVKGQTKLPDGALQTLHHHSNMNCEKIIWQEKLCQINIEIPTQCPVAFLKAKSRITLHCSWIVTRSEVSVFLLETQLKSTTEIYTNHVVLLPWVSVFYNNKHFYQYEWTTW